MLCLAVLEASYAAALAVLEASYAAALAVSVAGGAASWAADRGVGVNDDLSSARNLAEEVVPDLTAFAPASALAATSAIVTGGYTLTVHRF